MERKEVKKLHRLKVYSDLYTNDIMGLRCYLLKHKWVKVGGATNAGYGEFKIKLRCIVCNKNITMIR